MRINLLPPEERPQPLINPRRLTLMIGGGVLVFVAIGFAVLQFNGWRTARQEAALVEKRLEIMRGFEAQLKRYEELRRQVEQAKKEIETVKDSYQLEPRLIEAVAAVTPENIWLGEIASGADGAIKIKGDSLDFALIGDFLEKLQRTKQFTEIKLVKITENDEEDYRSYGFEINLNTGRAAQYAQ